MPARERSCRVEISGGHHAIPDQTQQHSHCRRDSARTSPPSGHGALRGAQEPPEITEADTEHLARGGDQIGLI